MRKTGPPNRSAFTLVEILTVIVIIGILAGIAIPAITGALRTARETAIRTDIDVMSQALEAYKLKYGSYPPDFSDWDAAERHIRNAFPGIDNNELRILAQFTHYDSSMDRTGESNAGVADPRVSNAFDHYPHAIDRAEALVFFLGGLSSDAKRPFTGQGGPLVKKAGTAFAAEPDGTDDDYLAYQYNSERDKGFFEFDPPRLSMVLLTTPSTFTYSDDEGTAKNNNNALGIVYHPDPFPVYRPEGSDLPLVYFHSRSYDMAWGTNTPAAWNSSLDHHYQSVYIPSGEIAETGVARPYASTVVDTTPPGSIAGITVPTGATVLQFAENTKFQIVSAGLDNNYGGVIASTWGNTAAGVPIYPSGEYYNPFFTFSPSGQFTTVSETNKYQDDLCLRTYYNGSEIYRNSPQLDNITNFSTRTLESDLQ